MSKVDKGYTTKVYFLVEWLNNCFSSNSELQVFISITSLNKCAMVAPVLSRFLFPPESSGNIKAKCKHCASYISGRTDTTSNFLTHLKVCSALDIYYMEVVGGSIYFKISQFCYYRVCCNKFCVLSINIFSKPNKNCKTLQTVWTQIRIDILSVLIWIQAVDTIRGPGRDF